MSAKKSWFHKLSIAAVVFGLVAISSVLITGEPAAQRSSRRVGVPDDWSHHHLIFSNPGTYEQAIASGTYSKWLNLQYDTRYIFQQMKRNHTSAGGYSPEMEMSAARATERFGLIGRPIPRPKRYPPALVKNDWQQTLGTYSPTPRVGGQYPAKFTFNGTANCSDYVVYTTGGATSTTTATVIAYTNLYGTSGPSGTGCGAGTSGGAVPTIAWAYNTSNGTAANATLSPVIDLAGDQVAYIQSTSTGASLVILRMNSTSGGTVAAPATATFATNANYKTCSAACYTTIALSGPHADTTSAPYYDYARDIIWVGDGSGNLHAFTNVFLGSTAPAESGAPFKSAVSTSALTSPVFDSSTGLVFVGDTGSGAPLHSVCGVTGINAICSTAGTLTTSGTISAGGMDDAPIVDSSASKAYVFIATDTSTSCLTGGGTATACSAVFQYTTTTSINTQTPVKAILGRGMSTSLYAGAFNDGYYSGGSATGALYVLAGSASHTTSGTPTLYKVAVTSGTMSASSTTGPTVATATGTPSGSPVAEFLNGSTDYLFLSVTVSGNDTGCTGACLYNYVIPTTFSSSLAATAGLAATSGSSGIIIDNSGSLTGSSQIYFYSLAAETCPTTSSGCAVQASQATP